MKRREKSAEGLICVASECCWEREKERQRTKSQAAEQPPKGVQWIMASSRVWRYPRITRNKTGKPWIWCSWCFMHWLDWILRQIDEGWVAESNNLRLSALPLIDVSFKANAQTYLYLLTDLNQFGHLVLQLAVSLHKVGQVVLQCLLSGERRQADRQSAFKAERMLPDNSGILCV